jgi:hypothetical protein
MGETIFIREANTPQLAAWVPSVSKTWPEGENFVAKGMPTAMPRPPKVCCGDRNFQGFASLLTESIHPN